MDYWKIQDHSANSSSNIDSIMQYYSTSRGDDSNRADSVSGSSITLRADSVTGSSITLTESNVGTFVEQVTGESLRYTVRDMDVIRREARVAADGSRDEIEQMRCACAGFEVIINNMQQMHNTRLQYKDEQMSRVIDERDSLQEDVSAMDKSFNDLSGRFARLREVLKNMQQNEYTMKEAMKAYDFRLKEELERYADLKTSSQIMVRRANEEIENVDEQHKKDNLTLRAELRRIQIRNQSLEEELIRKENENKELTQICDELIANQ